MYRVMYLSVPAAVFLAGCSDPNQAPVVFGQSQVFGVSVGAAATGTVPEFTVGYRDANIAILPTAARGPNGAYQNKGATLPGTDGTSSDTYSTFGQFQGTAETNKVGLNKFFATGLAAQRIADGFACAVSDGRNKAYCHTSTNHTTSTGTPPATPPAQTGTTGNP